MTLKFDRRQSHLKQNRNSLTHLCTYLCVHCLCWVKQAKFGYTLHRKGEKSFIYFQTMYTTFDTHTPLTATSHYIVSCASAAAIICKATGIYGRMYRRCYVLLCPQLRVFSLMILHIREAVGLPKRGILMIYLNSFIRNKYKGIFNIDSALHHWFDWLFFWVLRSISLHLMGMLPSWWWIWNLMFSQSIVLIETILW